MIVKVYPPNGTETVAVDFARSGKSPTGPQESGSAHFETDLQLITLLI